MAHPRVLSSLDSTSNLKMEHTLNRLQELASSKSGLDRQQLMSALHNLAYSLEDSNDVVHRFGYLVGLQNKASADQ